MEQNIIGYIHHCFSILHTDYNFFIKQEQNSDKSFFIEYNSHSIGIKVEKYFREFYVTTYRLDNPQIEINLFNLLDYLNQGNANAPKANYFRNETDIDKCYKKQVQHISNVIYDNYRAIDDFFNNGLYASNFLKLESYMKHKHPELFGI